VITLEQIRLLEDKITRAIDLIRVLKEENTTLRKGLDSAQRRMRELEGLVDGFKSDQKEIESVIIRTLKNLEDLDEMVGSGHNAEHGAASAGKKADSTHAQAQEDFPHSANHAGPSTHRSMPDGVLESAPGRSAAGSAVLTDDAGLKTPAEEAGPGLVSDEERSESPEAEAEAPEEKSNKGELDIF
jgi:FtsZ-binding cell division protein ZapB